MRLEPFFVALAALVGRSLARAAELRTIDVPEACLVICNPIVLLSNACYIEEEKPSSSTSPILVVPVSTLTTSASQTQQAMPPSAFAPAVMSPEMPATNQTRTRPPEAQGAWQTEYPETSSRPTISQPTTASRPPTARPTIEIFVPPVPLPLEGEVEHHDGGLREEYGGPLPDRRSAVQKRVAGVTQKQEEMAERTCLCENKSFNVQSLAGLCASCMAQNVSPAGDASGQLSDIKEIMTECSFTSTIYSPAATALAQDLTIVAVVPTLVPVGSSHSGSNDNNDDDDDDDDDEHEAAKSGGIDNNLSSSAATRLHSTELKRSLYLIASGLHV
ncbi:hypothetical protein GQ53DRAFT_811783 [Thozetella sp. PMI_491]|nr:hypothetical protein GQ53DRAFT_811783 [Thozetella sp. PMI_491]